MAEAQTYAARWIFPVDAPPLERGTITVRGDKIIAVEPHGTRTPDVDLGNVAILPGFVNAHTHLDLSGARGLLLPSPHRGRGVGGEGACDFTQWLRSVIAFRRSRTPEQVQADIAAGIAECLRFGTTIIGDISSGGASWDELGEATCRALVFYELIGLTQQRVEESIDAWDAWRAQAGAYPTCLFNLSPHAPYSTSMHLYLLAAHRSAHSKLPFATHLAETCEELELIRNKSGPFVQFLESLNAWEPDAFDSRLIDLFLRHHPGIFAHCNYLDPATPFTADQTVVFCPRTHAAFGHPRHPFPQFLQRGVRVALGTDSLASNPDLDILAEARFVRRHYPEVAPATILRMLTLSGAEALGFDADAGSLTPGKSADLVILPLPDRDDADPHDLVFDSALPVLGAMFRGERSQRFTLSP
jgi:cytosine/adenosine deaminase-related metal-dependent hydrolase